MTTSNGDDQDDQKQWEEVFTGDRLPAKYSEAEQEADALRQVLIWRSAKQMKTEHTPEDAAAFYKHLHDIQRQRKHARYLRWGKFALAAILAASIAGGLWYYLNEKSADTTTFKAPPKQDAMIVNQPSPNKVLPLIPELVAVPAGSFVMGCTSGWDDSTGGCRSNEYPAHSVDIKAFRLGRHEVTVGQFKHFVDATNYQTVAEQNNQGCSVIDPENPSRWIVDPATNWKTPGYSQTDSHPVVCLSWKDTQKYLTWLSSATNNKYRLPTEAEWEYAARAGRVTAFYWGEKGDRRFANYKGIADNDKWQNTAPVGLYLSNNFGLHDMSGNAWEWTASCWRENYQKPEVSSENCNNTRRARRGGGWDNSSPSIRSAYRSSGSEVERSNLYGFRVAHDH